MNKSYKVLIVSQTIRIISLFFILSFLSSCQEEEPEIPLELEAEIQHVSVFGGHDGAILVEISGGNPPYAFLWSSGDTTQDLTGISAGIYYLTVSDEIFQMATDTFLVKQPELEGVIDVDGNIYSVIEIGGQTWMQENLRVTHAPDGSEITSHSYYNDEDSIKKYGRLYTWDVAMNGSKTEGAQGICPDGWHLPTDDEWKQLEMALGMTAAQANLTNGWRGAPAGAMMKAGGSSGYEALLSGRRSSNGSFSLIGRMEYMWTSTEYGTTLAWRRCLDSASADVGRWNTFPKSYGFSVRCVKND